MSDQTPMTPPEDAACNRRSSRSDGSARLPDCDICEQPQVELGAVAFSPPDENGRCEKLHVCAKCWKKVKYALRGRALDRLTKEAQRLGFYDLPNAQMCREESVATAQRAQSAAETAPSPGSGPYRRPTK